MGENGSGKWKMKAKMAYVANVKHQKATPTFPQEEVFACPRA